MLPTALHVYDSSTINTQTINTNCASCHTVTNCLNKPAVMFISWTRLSIILRMWKLQVNINFSKLLKNIHIVIKRKILLQTTKFSYLRIKSEFTRKIFASNRLAVFVLYQFASYRTTFRTLGEDSKNNRRNSYDTRDES